jgi:hypothetical protein
MTRAKPRCKAQCQCKLTCARPKGHDGNHRCANRLRSLRRLRAKLAATLLIAATACATEWQGAELALACSPPGEGNTRYAPLQCSGAAEVLGSMDRATITLADGRVCMVRVVGALVEGEPAFGGGE